MPAEIDFPSRVMFWKWDTQWGYASGLGTFESGSLRRSYERRVIERVPARAEHWVNQLLPPEVRDADAVVTLSDDDLRFAMSIPRIDDVDDAADRIGRRIAGAILLKVLGPDRKNWPAVPDAPTGPGVEDNLSTRSRAHAETMRYALEEARFLQTSHPDFVVAHHRLEELRGRAIKKLKLPHPPVTPEAFGAAYGRILAELAVAQRQRSDLAASDILRSRARVLAAGKGDDPTVAFGLAVLIRDSDGDTDIRAFLTADPIGRNLFSSNEAGVALAPVLARERARRALPAIALPSTARPISNVSAPRAAAGAGTEALFEVEIDALVASVVNDARRITDVSAQYHFLEQKVDELARSNDPDVVLAARRLHAFIREQKERWAEPWIVQMLSRPVDVKAAEARVPWKLTDGLGLCRGDVDHTHVSANAVAWDESLDGAAAVRVEVAQAWRRILQMIDPSVIAAVPPCRIIFMPDNHRAYHYEDFMVVGKTTKAHTILHEFGHHLEDHLPPEVWYRAQDLMASRSGGAERKVGINHPADDEVGFVGEVGIGRIRRYSTRYYGGTAATEVVSTGLEAFGRPEETLQLYLEDPAQFALMMSIFSGGAWESTGSPEPRDVRGSLPA